MLANTCFPWLAEYSTCGTPELVPNSIKPTTPPTRNDGRKPHGADTLTLGLILPETAHPASFSAESVFLKPLALTGFVLSTEDVVLNSGSALCLGSGHARPVPGGGEKAQ